MSAAGPVAVVVGLPGAGKSTTGRRLAKILAVPFTDSDELVEASRGRSVGDIFATDGEAAFRAAEAEAVATALRDFAGVLSLGGGALTDDRTRAAVASAGVPVVFLRATVATLATRVGDGRTRPLLEADPPVRLAELAEARRRLYDEVATITVDTDGRTPGQVAATVASRLHDLGAV